ncbi:DUF418 domain-containing protein [Marinicrinis lubricantis]|uniref:DUF418 domain-containing protein n=1 Tax=Marinicrinis lubricantis TaxID=2086470 RepID=A0ABW1IQ46_9BACL
MGEQRERIRLLDILRGFAILGTLGTNIWIFAYLGDLSYITTYAYTEWRTANDLLRMIVLFLVNGKLLGLLTIMFGAGMELKYRQSKRKNLSWPGGYMWVLLFLGLEGLLHFIFVLEYDILMSYAVTGIIAAYIVKRGDRLISITMKWIGSVVAFLMLAVLALGLLGANMSLGSFDEVAILYQNGTWLEQVQYRLTNFLPLRSEAILVIPSNVFLFLLGVRLMRAGVFAPGAQGKKHRRKLFQLGIYVGVPLNLLIFIPGGAFDLPVRYLFAPILSLGYIAVIGHLIQWKKCEWLWKLLENAGKMSLSCYVIQNIISATIFYGWGLALGGKLNSLAITAVWLCICSFLLVFATLWLLRFKLGPLEMLRRSAIAVFTSRSR